jgi:hypothetical protein
MAFLGSTGGSNRNTGRGGFHPGVGPVDINYPVSVSTGTELQSPVNGLQLRINNTQDVWTTYENLPAFLTGVGKVTSTVINETDSGTFTVTQPCRVWLLRSANWNAVDVSAYTLYSTLNNVGIDGSNTSIYYRDVTPGTYPYDNNSAMYIWSFDNPVSEVSGTLGTTVVNGTGADIANTSSTRISGQRGTYDPFHNGPVTYSISAGSLPPGFTLNASTGQITGKYTASGVNTDGTVYSFTVRATDNSPGAKSTSDRSYTVTLSVPWLYRQIITTCYMAGGYKDAAAWSNVNRFPRSTETCVNLGDGLIDSYNYKSGMCSDDGGYVFGAGGGHSTALNTTSKFNLRTETKGSNPGGPGFNCSNTGTVFAPDRNRSFTVGDGVSNCFRFTASTASFATLGGGQGGSACGISGENKGIWWGDANRRIEFSTESQATISMAGGAHGQQKGMSAKTGYGYGGNEGTYAGGYNFRKTNIAAESYGTIGKPWPNCGEENFGMTQDNGYMIGQYDDSIGQNNRCGRTVYATDANAQLSTTVQGHNGASSGHCFWRD